MKLFDRFYSIISKYKVTIFIGFILLISMIFQNILYLFYSKKEVLTTLAWTSNDSLILIILGNFAHVSIYHFSYNIFSFLFFSAISEKIINKKYNYKILCLIFIFMVYPVYYILSFSKPSPGYLIGSSAFVSMVIGSTLYLNYLKIRNESIHGNVFYIFVILACILYLLTESFRYYSYKDLSSLGHSLGLISGIIATFTYVYILKKLIKT